MREPTTIHASGPSINAGGGKAVHTQCGEMDDHRMMMIGAYGLLALRELQKEEPDAHLGRLCCKCLKVLMGDTS